MRPKADQLSAHGAIGSTQSGLDSPALGGFLVAVLSVLLLIFLLVLLGLLVRRLFDFGLLVLGLLEVLLVFVLATLLLHRVWLCRVLGPLFGPCFVDLVLLLCLVFILGHGFRSIKGAAFTRELTEDVLRQKQLQAGSMNLRAANCDGFGSRS